MMEETNPADTSSEVVSKGNPLWLPNSQAPRCLRCNNSFTLTLRRHHCRVCGDVICKRCSTKATVKKSDAGILENHPDGDQVRCCHPCRDQLLAGTGVDISISHQARQNAVPVVERVRPTAPPREMWVKDSESKNCLKCGNKFTLFVRRHHCRLCGHVICSKCTSWARCTVSGGTVRSDPLAKELRACHPCHEQILQESVQHLQSFAPPSEDSKRLVQQPATPAVPLFPSSTDWGDETAEKTAIALFDFDAEQEGDLGFKVDDVITLLSWSDNPDQWWEGKLGASVGVFPGNLVRMM